MRSLRLNWLSLYRARVHRRNRLNLAAILVKLTLRVRFFFWSTIGNREFISALHLLGKVISRLSFHREVSRPRIQKNPLALKSLLLRGHTALWIRVFSLFDLIWIVHIGFGLSLALNIFHDSYRILGFFWHNMLHNNWVYIGFSRFK